MLRSHRAKRRLRNLDSIHVTSKPPIKDIGGFDVSSILFNIGENAIMASNTRRAILIDTIELGLDPSQAYSAIARGGRLAASMPAPLPEPKIEETVSNVVEPKVKLALTQLEPKAEETVSNVVESTTVPVVELLATITEEQAVKLEQPKKTNQQAVKSEQSKKIDKPKASKKTESSDVS